MTDRHDEEDETREHPAARPVAPSEGVRIIGAEEAAAALESGAVGRRVPDSEPRFGDVPPRPDAPRSGLSFPNPDPTLSDEPTAEHPLVVGETGGDELLGEVGPGADVAGDAGTEVAPPAPEGLPHWSEPATGEVPVIPGGTESDEDDAAISELGGPRFRTGGADWSEDELETFKVLAADEDEGEQPVVPLSVQEIPPEDDDVAFDREVAARRVRTVSGAGPAAVRPRPPRARPEGEPPGGEDARNDTLVRVVTGLGMAALALLCLNAGPDWTMVLATAIVAVCTFELFSALHTRGFRPAAVIGLLGSLTIVPLAYHRGEFAFPFTFALVTIFTLLWFVFEVVHTRPMVNVAVTIGGFAYTGGLGAFAGLLLTSANGVGLILGVALPVIAYDIFGFFVGSQFGKTRLAPHISPNKTVEGLIGGMTGSIIVAVLIVKQIHPWGGLGDAFALGITVAIMAPLGDLAESMLKRDLGIKDFGTLLPGHGGVLDRFDAILFCLPAVYFLARALTIG